MSDTLDWLCGEIGITRELLISPRRDKFIVNKRKIAVVFFRLLGKSSPWVGAVMNRDHSSVMIAQKTANDEEKARACELIKKYNKRILGESIDELKIDNIRRKIKVKVPNYKTGKIDEIEVFADEYKPKLTVLNFKPRYKL